MRELAVAQILFASAAPPILMRVAAEPLYYNSHFRNWFYASNYACSYMSVLEDLVDRFPNHQEYLLLLNSQSNLPVMLLDKLSDRHMFLGSIAYRFLLSSSRSSHNALQWPWGDDLVGLLKSHVDSFWVHCCADYNLPHFKAALIDPGCSAASASNLITGFLQRFPDTPFDLLILLLAAAKTDQHKNTLLDKASKLTERRSL